MDGLALPPSPMQALQAEHERLLGRLDDSGGTPCPGPTHPPIEQLSFETQALIHEARAYVERAKAESEWVSDARDRSQLRANLRFWASFLLNCTGAYPDTTLRPARPFMSDLSGLPKTPPSGAGIGEASGKPQAITGSALNHDLSDLDLEEEAESEATADTEAEASRARPTWFSRLSRFFGLFAILIVGVIPLAAVCMALSLFYNLDNQSPWASAGNPATQTAMAAQQLPSPTPISLATEGVIPTPDPLAPYPGVELPRLIAQVSMGQSASQGPGCVPVLVLSLNAPKTSDGVPIPAVNAAIYPAGAAQPLERVALEPGASPLSLALDGAGPANASQDWLVQAEHPWLGVEAVILSRALFENCDQNQVTIVYQAESDAEVWQRAQESVSPDDLSLSWELLTWGPEALGGQTWVAVLALQASGGNGAYVFFARGDLATQNTRNGLLSDDRAVLEQAICVPAVAQAGVTSAGQSKNLALSVLLVVPECR